MKRLVMAATLLAGSALALLRGQTLDLRATIPFEFHVGLTELPAGDYVIRHLPDGELIVRTEDGRNVAITPFTLDAFRPSRLAKGQLEFNRYGDTYFLTTLWAPELREGVALPKTAKEKELALAARRPEKTTIALQRK